MTRLIPALTGLVALPSHAHEGHGLGGTHWHASDTWGFITVAALAAAAWWYGRDKD